MHSLLLRFLLATTIAFSLANHAGADIVSAQILDVHDGDTVTAQIAHGRPFHVRLNGIDAPELDQAYGAESRDALRAAVLGQPVLLDLAKLDIYGRTIGRILHDGKDVNLEQIRTGNAWFYRSYQRDLSLPNKALYSDAEASAKQQLFGLWRLIDPVAPWDYRKQRKSHQ